MKKRIVSSLLAVAMIMTLLGGCGTKQGETTKTEPAVAETEKTEGNTEAAKESEVLADGSEVELSFWYPISQESEANWYAMMVQKFNEEYAGKIKILETANTRGESFAYEDKVSAAAATNSLPDILMADGPNVASYAYSNMFIPIEDYFTEEDMKDFLPSTIAQGTYDGHFYAVGMGEGIINIYYNKDMLDAAGITAPEKIEDAWTWDEYYDVCKKLTKDGIYGGNFIQEKSGEWIIVAFQPFLVANGAQLLSDDGSKAEGYINSEKAIQTGIYLQKFADEGLINVDPTAMEFQEGKCATKLAGAWIIPTLEQADFNWGVTYIPQKEAYAGSTSGGWTVGVTPNCQNVDAAMEFIHYLSSPEACASFTVDGPAYPPVRYSAYDLLDIYDDGPNKIIKETLFEEGHARPATPNYPIFTQKFSEAFYDILLGADVKTSLDDIANSFDKEWEATYAK